ncbi:unnamed protein product, partial [Ixodes pacificus]
IVQGNLATSPPTAATIWFVKVDLAGYCASAAVVRVAPSPDRR